MKILKIVGATFCFLAVFIILFFMSAVYLWSNSTTKFDFNAFLLFLSMATTLFGYIFYIKNGAKKDLYLLIIVLPLFITPLIIKMFN